MLYTMGSTGSGRGRPITAERAGIPDRADLLPESIRRYTQRIADETHRSFVQGGGHGGSHPHLVNEFVSSILAARPPAVDHIAAANWTAVGLAAHASAQAGGEWVSVPTF